MSNWTVEQEQRMERYVNACLHLTAMNVCGNGPNKKGGRDALDEPWDSAFQAMTSARNSLTVAEIDECNLRAKEHAGIPRKETP